MISISEGRLAAVLSRFFPNPDDPGPYNPHAHVLEPNPLPWRHIEPDPSPWRQVVAVAGLIRGARLVEATSKGSGAGFLRTVFDDPDNWCPTLPRPHFPTPPQPPRLDELDFITIGAAFVALADGIPESDLADAAREGGGELMARGAREG